MLDALKEAETRHTADFQVTPSGEYAAFPTTAPLTGYENSGYSEVFRFDAATNELDCASCDPTNAQATGNASLASNGSSLADDGRVFFNSDDALVLRDTDNRQDVYEWEAVGAGTCQSESPDFFSLDNECVSLISSGSSPFDSGLLSVSADGTDAFFFTHDTLAPQDHNGPITKIYDAREAGGFFVIPEPPLCASSDECHGPGSQSPSPSNLGTFRGTGGNYTPPPSPCRQGFLAKNGRCVRKPHKMKHHHKRTSTVSTGGESDPPSRAALRSLVAGCLLALALLSAKAQASEAIAPHSFTTTTSTSRLVLTPTYIPSSNSKAPANPSRRRTWPSTLLRGCSATPTRSPSALHLISPSTSVAPTRKPG